MNGRASHPSAHHQRSMAEPMLIAALSSIIRETHNRNERQLASLCRDLIEMAGDRPNVKNYLDRKAVEALDEARPWG